jgi:CheY-like chemotaxis protein
LPDTYQHSGKGNQNGITNSTAVIAELQQRYPEVPVIAISGLFNSGHGMDADAAIALGAARALAKPFKRGDLFAQSPTYSVSPNQLLSRCVDRDRGEPFHRIRQRECWNSRHDELQRHGAADALAKLLSQFNYLQLFWGPIRLELVPTPRSERP